MWLSTPVYVYCGFTRSLRLVLYYLQAEEQLKLVDEQRKVLEERQARERLERQKHESEQALILNKNDKKRAKLSFSLQPRWLQYIHPNFGDFAYVNCF